MNMVAGDKRIQAFDPVDGSSLNKLCQGPVDLKRRAQPVITKRIQNVIGACRFSVRLKIVINIVSGCVCVSRWPPAVRTAPARRMPLLGDKSQTSGACGLVLASPVAGC